MIKINPKSTLIYCAMLILIDFMGLTITIVTFPKLLLSNLHSILPVTFSYNHKFMLMAFLLALYPFGQFFGAASLGKISDHWGRKNILLISLCGTFIGFFFTAISITYSLIPLLYISRFISGLFAGNVSIAQATITDISTPETKGKNLTIAQSAMGSAWIIGPVVGAYLSEPIFFKSFNLATPYWSFCILFFIFFIFTIFMFKDTSTKESRINFQIFQGVQGILKGFSNNHLRTILSIWFLFVCGWWLFEAFMPAYLFKNFNYSTIQLGHILTFNGLLFVFSQFFIVSRIIKHVKPENLVKYSGLIAGFAMLVLAFIPNNALVYATMAMFVLGMSFTLPGFITSISNRESENAQGQIMGIINSTQSFATIFVILLGGVIYRLHPDITVLTGGAITMFSTVLFILLCK